jgi:hypothetical protein
MVKIIWEQFKLKYEDYRQAFEDLCYYLFCRKFNIAEGIPADFNQTGLETYPILSKGKYYGFQAKFFDNGTNYNEIEKSVKNALKNYKGRLDVICIYLNSDAKLGSKSAKKIERLATKNKVEIEWFTKSKFKVFLNQPTNLDLAQFYFGIGDEIGFIKGSFPSVISTLLQSSEYIDLPLKEQSTDSSIMTNQLGEKILSSEKKVFLITGHPGSGKSILMYKLFQEFGGLDKKDTKEMKKLIDRNGAIPMLVNLKNCASDSLENIIRSRQKDFKIRRGNIKFIYLLDGLDEIGEERADSMLSDIQALEGDANTKKIIISSRLGTRNLAMLKVYQSKIAEYKIDDLSSEYIDKFFEAKNNNGKISKLNILKQDNAQILANAKDILLIRLLWDTIDELDKNSTVVDLFNYKLKLLLSDPKHKKNLEELDIPNPKEEQIISLNKELTFMLQKEFRFRFSINELQEVVLDKFPRITYKSANAIVEYLAKLFFDYQDSENQKFYTYQHRTYQEFFLAQKLKEEYDKDAAVLRKLNILPNQTFFEGLFLKYLKKVYKSEGNLIGLIELGVINEYLSIDRYWGADKPYYANSPDFIPALTSQNDSILEKLLGDENLQIMEKILIDINKLKENFAAWNKDKKDFYSESYLKDIYGTGVAYLIRAIAIFWQSGQETVANKLVENFENVWKLYEENKFTESLDEKERRYSLRDPFWEEWENWIYSRIVIKKGNIEKVFNKVIKGNYKNFSDEVDHFTGKSYRQELIEPFIRICLRYKQDEFINLVDEFDDYEFLVLLNVLAEIEFIPILVSDKSLQRKIKKFITKYKPPSPQTNLHITFTFSKKLLGFELSKEEKEFIDAQYEKARNDLDTPLHLNHKDFSLYNLLTFISQEFILRNIVEDAKKDPHDDFYHGYILYASLFSSFIKLIQAKIDIKEIVRDYIFYINTHQRSFHQPYQKDFYRKEISILWAHIFSYRRNDFEDLLALKNRLSTEENAIDFIAFANELNKMDKNLFSKLINEDELRHEWNKITKENKDFHSYIDNCFQFASLFASINEQKAVSYILKGINDGILRHGYHKDVIVSYELVDALEILWRNNWLPKRELKKYTEKVFKLAWRVAEITDKDETGEGPATVINLVANYDISLAEKLKNTLMKKTDDYYLINDAVTSILISKIKLSYSIEDIEKGMEEYKVFYGEQYLRDSYEKKFKVYLIIAQSNLYIPSGRKKAFYKAYEQVEEMKKRGIKYFLIDSEFRKEKEEFVKLCRKYKKPSNVSFEEKKDYGIERHPLISESEFVKNVKKAKAREEILELYSQLKNHENYIILEKSSSWEILVNKTFQILDNIQPFIELLKENHFPTMYYYSHYSKYFPYGVAAALKRNDTKAEMELYLSENGGHDSFLNMMNIYEAKNDKEMCFKLFQRYLRFCNFLVR